MKRTVIGMLAGAGALAGLLAAVSVVVAAERGPIAALDKARSVAADAADRADEMNAAAAEPPGGAAEDAVAPDRRDGEDAEPRGAATGADAAAGADDGPAPEETQAAPESSKVARASERYDPAKHRDPFEPPTVAAENAENPRTPLERYEIGQLKLVGVVWGAESSRAMVEDSAGLGYIVFPGTPIGSKGGFVRDIEPTRVLIEEASTNFYGEAEPREVVLELPQEDASP